MQTLYRSAGLLAGLLFLTQVSVAQTASSGLPNPYLRGEGVWGNLPDGRAWGAASAIHYAGGDRIWVADRCGGNRGPGSCEDRLDVDPIFLIDSAGNIISRFGAGLFVWPHGMFVDQQGNLWVTDAATAGKVGRVIRYINSAPRVSC